MSPEEKPSARSAHLCLARKKVARPKLRLLLRMSKIIQLAVYLLFVFVPVLATEYTVKTIPNPHELWGSQYWVSDPDNHIDDSWESRINGLLTNIEQKTTAEIAVVIVNSIGSEVPKDFSTNLFNAWGIGKEGKDNGLLLLLVMNQRRWEFETGYGLEGDLPDVFLKQAGDNFLVPRLREKKTGQGIYEVLEEVGKKIEGAEVSSSPGYRVEARRHSAKEKLPWGQILGILLGTAVSFIMVAVSKGGRKFMAQKPGFRDYLRFWGKAVSIPLFLLFFTVTGNLIKSLFFLFPLIIYLSVDSILVSFRKAMSTDKTSYQKYNALQKEIGWGLLFMSILLPFIGLPYWLLLQRRLKKLRSDPRVCPACNIHMEKKNEIDDNVFLDDGQKTEEKIGSIDYDVWICPSCKHVEVEPYDPKFTEYQKCPSCNYKTYYQSVNRTIASATCSSSGEGERTYICTHCKHTEKERYTIPEMDCSSSSSDGGSSSGGGGSSGGGSFGGGDSGGGGSGGSW